jgi:5-(carboxyamino)imidazole ribonucleotide synthase
MNRIPHALPPGATIGIIGGGQLGRMLALAAARLGFETVVLTPESENCAGAVAGRVLKADYADTDALAQLARLAQVVTFEFENVPTQTLDVLSGLGCQVAPGGKALAVAQDRVEEKIFLNGCGAPTVDFAPVSSLDELIEAMARIGAPALLKTRRDGYDGKGQVWIENHDHATAQAAFASLGAKPCILEAPAAFVRELSVIAARGYDGEIAAYPLGENHHEAGILRRTSAPARVSAATLEQAQTIAARILTALDYVGVMGVEMFELADGHLLVNEIAPRVHNTGHWTLDGCEVDQFEQHIRAITGLPLGDGTRHSDVMMENLIGDDMAQVPTILREGHAALHLYGKGEARAGRKMGHVNRILPAKAKP